MSQYISFYIKSTNGEMMPIGTYSRSNKIYQYGQYNVASYSVVKPLTCADLQSIIAEIREDINDYQKKIEKETDKIHMIVSAIGTSIDDKASRIDEYYDTLEYLKEEKARVKAAYDFYLVLKDSIIDDAKNFGYAPDDYIYAGVECARYADELED